MPSFPFVGLHTCIVWSLNSVGSHTYTVCPSLLLSLFPFASAFAWLYRRFILLALAPFCMFALFLAPFCVHAWFLAPFYVPTLFLALFCVPTLFLVPFCMPALFLASFCVLALFLAPFCMPMLFLAPFCVLTFVSRTVLRV